MMIHFSEIVCALFMEKNPKMTLIKKVEIMTQTTAKLLIFSHLLL